MEKETTMEEATMIWCQSLEKLANQLSVATKEIREDESNNDLR